jgi:hypothetical protein
MAQAPPGSIPGQSTWICGGQSGTGTGFPRVLRFSPVKFFLCQFHSTGAPLLGKGQKMIIIVIFIIGLHNKPHGCSASVASAAGSFTTKKESGQYNATVSFIQELHVSV